MSINVGMSLEEIVSGGERLTMASSSGAPVNPTLSAEIMGVNASVRGSNSQGWARAINPASSTIGEEPSIKEPNLDTSFKL